LRGLLVTWPARVEAGGIALLPPAAAHGVVEFAVVFSWVEARRLCGASAACGGRRRPYERAAGLFH